MEHQPFTIRKANEKDLDRVYQLINELEGFILDIKNFRALYIRNLNNSDFCYFVAEHQNLVVGFISLNFQYPLHHCGKIAEIQELIVTKQSRNLKIGSALLATVKKIAKETACDTLELTSRFKRVDAHRFYEREGFQKTHFKFLMRFD